MTLRFERFDVDGSTFTSQNISVTVNKDLSITAVYLEEEPMMSVIISGIVSAQASAGEEVKIKITRPDNSQIVLSAFTQNDRSFSLEYSDSPGTYSVVAEIGEDALYKAATSNVVSFTLEKLDRTITVTVS